MDDDVRERLETIERAVTNGDVDLSALAAEADAAERIADLEDRIATLDDRVREQEAAVQALRGYVGNVRSVNRDVARRADAALAAVESLESAGEDGAATRDRGSRTTPADSQQPAAAAERDSEESHGVRTSESAPDPPQDGPGATADRCEGVRARSGAPREGMADDADRPDGPADGLDEVRESVEATARDRFARAAAAAERERRRDCGGFEVRDESRPGDPRDSRDTRANPGAPGPSLLGRIRYLL